MRQRIPTKNIFLSTFLFLIAILLGTGCTNKDYTNVATVVEWPEVTPTTKPWTRWWWHGSAVNKEDLSLELEAYQQTGLGGVELTPIFGVIGREDDFIEYLSPEWMELFDHSLREAQRLALGFDMATGTGWPFGGPWVGADDAPKYIAYRTYELSGGESLNEPLRYIQKPILRAVRNQLYQLYGSILRKEGEEVVGSVEQPIEINRENRLQITDLVEPISANDNLQALALDQVRFEKPLPLQVLVAYSEDGQVEHLTNKVDENGRLDWTAPPGNWTLYALFQGWHGKMVERAAPGGEGHTLDHFSYQAIRNYLQQFDSSFAGKDLTGLRAYFNDSYEVDDAYGNADWTPDLFAEFQSHRGYDLRDHLPALFGAGDEEEIVRVGMDFRETLSDLLLGTFTNYWGSWAHDQGKIIRNQSHGSPANILDLYAASDIPETEGEDLYMIKFASSAAHVSGKKLVSSESATWLNDHFLSSLGDIRKNLERYFLGGVNHVFYHGTTYSPQNEPWPGRLFYAAVHLNPRNPLWRDFSALNQYAARVQSFLQVGRPDNDVLLYFPIFDRFAKLEPGTLEHFHGREAGFEESDMKSCAVIMQERGFTYDYISDRQIKALENDDQWLRSGDVRYQVVVIPETEYLPLETFRRLMELAEKGATVIFNRQLPQEVSGWHDLDNRRKTFEELKAQLNFSGTGTAGIQVALQGEGRFLVGDNLEAMLTASGVKRENMTDAGLQFTRRSHESGHHYFIANWSDEAVEGWFPLGVPAASSALFNPESGRKGLAHHRTNTAGAAEVYLQLAPHQTMILKTFSGRAGGETYPVLKAAGMPIDLQESWSIRFITGGPELPAGIENATLGSWTQLEGEAYRKFSGTAVYTTIFVRPEDEPGDSWILDLGEVAVSTRAKLNGTELGTRIGPGFRFYIPDDLLQPENTLEVEVTNLAANRIADLDRRNVMWKKFYNVNFPARLAENRGANGLFDASDWEPVPSGLLGPVRLEPVEVWDPE